jgi:transposase
MREKQEKAAAKRPKGTKCRKIRLNPSSGQREKLELWRDAARFAYNLAVDAYNETAVYEKNALKELAGTKTGRKRRKRDANGELIGDKSPAGDDPWKKVAPSRMWGVPAKIRSRAVEMVSNAIASFKAVEKNRGKPLPKLKHRRSKDDSQSFVIEAALLNCKTRGEAYSLFGGPKNRVVMKLERRKGGRGKPDTRLPDIFDSDVTIAYSRKTGEFSICIPVEVADRRPDTQGAAVTTTTESIIERDMHIASIDPGIKTFATVYDHGRQRIVECGGHGGRKDGSGKGIELLGWLARKVSRLESAATRAPCARSRRRIKALAQRIRDRMRNLVDEMHKKIALWLCREYSVVLLPKFEPSKLSRRKTRSMAKRSVRKMLALAPYRFRAYLLHKAREYGTRVSICNERWSSKTCTACGRVKHDLKLTDRVYKCAHCKAVYDRDAGAARNILILWEADHYEGGIAEWQMEGDVFDDFTDRQMEGDVFDDFTNATLRCLCDNVRGQGDAMDVAD